MRSRRDAIRSLIPSRSIEPAESFSSVTAASRNCRTSPWASASRSTPSDVERTLARMASAARTRRLQIAISTVLASHTVQVTSEAKASPIRTAFTTGSALIYMPHGLRSRGNVAVARTSSCANAGMGRAINAAVRALRALAGRDAGRNQRRPVRTHPREISRHCISTSLISHRVPPPPLFQGNIIAMPREDPRPPKFSAISRLFAAVTSPLFSCLQLASGGDTAGNVFAHAPAPPPHDHTGHGEYQGEDPGQEHRELPDLAAVAALVDPPDPLRRTVAAQRAWLTFHVAAAIVHHDG